MFSKRLYGRSRMKLLNLIITISFSLSTAVATASEAVGWRTDGTGRYPNANPPTKWSITS